MRIVLVGWNDFDDGLKDSCRLKKVHFSLKTALNNHILEMMVSQ